MCLNCCVVCDCVWFMFWGCVDELCFIFWMVDEFMDLLVGIVCDSWVWFLSNFCIRVWLNVWLLWMDSVFLGVFVCVWVWCWNWWDCWLVVCCLLGCCVLLWCIVWCWVCFVWCWLFFGMSLLWGLWVVCYRCVIVGCWCVGYCVWGIGFGWIFSLRCVFGVWVVWLVGDICFSLFIGFCCCCVDWLLSLLLLLWFVVLFGNYILNGWWSRIVLLWFGFVDIMLIGMLVIFWMWDRYVCVFIGSVFYVLMLIVFFF